MTGDAAPTTREALARELEALGVNQRAYHLFGAHVDDAFVIDRRPEGWVVFYSERGGEFSLTTHSKEADACADLHARVTREPHVYFELVAGPAPREEADAAFDAWLLERGVSEVDLRDDDLKFDDVPWVAGPYWRRYFVKTLVARGLSGAP